MNIIRGGLIGSYNNDTIGYICIAILAIYGIAKLIKKIANKKENNDG